MSNVMNEPQVPIQSLSTIFISLVVAILLALFILIAIVGPAEYGIDPTGLGKRLGLTVLSKSQLPSENAVIECPSDMEATAWKDVVLIMLPANSGLEYKFHMQEGQVMGYQWSTAAKESLYFDFHGEPDGDHTGYFKSYLEATQAQSEGQFKAPFKGIHGWYWQNKSSSPVSITLKTRGEYEIKGLM